jgi:uncharacterized membrane-anchored protein
LVEGLSVIAAAYYLVGLIAYMTKGLAAINTDHATDIIMGAVTLPVMLLIYLFVNRLRHKVLKETGGENTHIE